MERAADLTKFRLRRHIERLSRWGADAAGADDLAGQHVALWPREPNPLAHSDASHGHKRARASGQSAAATTQKHTPQRPAANVDTRAQRRREARLGELRHNRGVCAQGSRLCARTRAGRVGRQRRVRG